MQLDKTKFITREIMSRRHESKSNYEGHGEFREFKLQEAGCFGSKKREARVAGHPQALRETVPQEGHLLDVRVPGGSVIIMYAESGQTLQGSLSAVSKPTFASNTRWKTLAEIYTMHSFAPFSNLKMLVKICNFLFFRAKSKFCQNFADFSPNRFHGILSEFREI